MELIVKFDDKVIERVVVEKRRITIGRTSDNDVILENRGISRRHASIIHNGQTVEIIDNESLNGILVNNRKVSAEILKDGDVITIGMYTITYHAEATPKIASENATGKHRVVTERPSAKLVMVKNATRAEYPLGSGATFIGTQKSVEIPVKSFRNVNVALGWDSCVTAFCLERLNGKGTIRCNNQAIDQCYLRNGDIIQIGRSIFRFECK